MNKKEALSTPSRTNQLKIVDSSKKVADKLFHYLRNAGKGIEHFELKYPPELKCPPAKNSPDEIKARFYRERHRYIKKQIEERLSPSDPNIKSSEIQYFRSYVEGKTYVFFLSEKKDHSGWTKLFENNRERILNLVFKFYLLAQVLDTETIKGFEELFLVHSKNLGKKDSTESQKGKPLFFWGHNLLVQYNQHGVLTLNLSRKSKLFLPKDDYVTRYGGDLGKLFIHKKKDYCFDRDLDARRQNSINFMKFPQDPKDYKTFKKTQLYHYQNLMTKLEYFLKKCQIKFERLDFQANSYLEKPFLEKENLESVESLEIINNTGIDLTESDQEFLTNFLQHQGISSISFYNSGQTISTYEQQEVESENAPAPWKITERQSWSEIKLDKSKNYLIFNKLLEEEAGSMAYQREDGLWCPSTEIDDQTQVDFYSQLKRRINYLETGEFVSTQGINISEFKALKKKESILSVLTYTGKYTAASKKSEPIDLDILRKDTQLFTPGQWLEVEEHLFSYLRQQKNKEEWEKFKEKYKIKISPEYEKVLIELRIKNWMRQSLIDKDNSIGLPIPPQSFAEGKKFVSIYVRSFREKEKETKAVAVRFIYQDGCIHIEDIIRDLKQIKKTFRKCLRTRKNSEELINEQHYLIDESAEKFISCYTSDYFTPKLIGRHGILEEMENGKLEINRGTSKLLPLVSYYNDEIKPINQIKR